MRDIPTASTYGEPTVLWRMQRGERQSSHAVISPKADGARVLWFVNSHLLGMRDFDDWTEAITWSDRIRDQNWTVGWRLSEDD
jgi:hypothetical protein